MARSSAARTITFGESVDADVVADEVTLDVARPTFWVRTPWGAHRCDCRSADGMVGNAAAAIAAAGVLGVDVAAATANIAEAELSASRMAIHRLRSGAVVIDDAYNANPTSMVAALDALVAMPAIRRVAVLGVMAELDEAAAAHRAVADRLGEQASS